MKNAGTNNRSDLVRMYLDRFDYLLRHYEWHILSVSPAPLGAARWPSALGSVVANQLAFIGSLVTSSVSVFTRNCWLHLLHLTPEYPVDPA